MGSAQSHQTEERPKVVRINREEIPEEYKTVGVSGSVINRVNSQMREGVPPGAGIAADIDVEKLRSELQRERGEKERLRHEMNKLTELHQRVESQQAAPVLMVGDDIEERKRIFDDTVERVQKQFFAYQRENVCEENEKEIMACLKANPNRVLKCTHLVGAYEKCVADFRQEVLKGN